MAQYGGAYFRLFEELELVQEQLEIIRLEKENIRVELDAELTNRFVINRAFAADSKILSNPMANCIYVWYGNFCNDSIVFVYPSNHINIRSCLRNIVHILLLALVSFVICNTFLIANERYWGVLIPLLLVVITMALLRLDLLLTTVAFLTPLSTSLKELGIYNPIGVEMALPTEPLLLV